MKKGIVSLFVLLSFAFAFSFVSAVNEDVIMEFSSSTNAHAGLWNSSYDYILNYTQIFGFVYAGDSMAVHDCSSNPIFLWLSSENNSHVSTFNDATYNIPVCYGNMNCRVANASADEDCIPTTETLIARLSYVTNAHISNVTDTNYPYKICCGGVGNPQPGEVYWYDLAGHNISTANRYDTVKMVLWGTDLGNVDFEVYDSAPVPDEKVYNVSAVAGIDKAAAYWRTQEPGEYYFIADVDGDRTNSGTLTVVDSISNSPTNITIISPSCGFIGNTSTNVGVEVSIVDVDDVVEGTINFGDGQSANVSNNQTSYVFSHNYTQAGSYKILVNVSDQRGNWRVKDVNIIILRLGTGGLFLASCISEPVDYANIPGASAFFSAASTVAVDYDGTLMTKIMPGGDESERMYFQWSFNGIADNDGPFLGNETTAYNFTKIFAQSGHNWADVVINFN